MPSSNPANVQMASLDRPSLGPMAVDEFLAGLSSWDVLHLRARLRNMEIHGLKVIEDMPIDVICQIAQWLHPNDLFKAITVCRTWKAIFTSDAVLSMACSNLFPGLRESRPDCKDLLELLRETYWLYGREFLYHVRPPPGIPKSPMTATLNGIKALYGDGKVPSDGSEVVHGGKPITVYGYGNLAYQVKDEIRVVYVGNGSVRKHVVPADRRKSRGSERVVAISKDLLVVAQSSMAVTTERPDHPRLL